MAAARSILDAAKALLLEGGRTSWTLFRILVPISIATRILAQMGVLEHLGAMLGPVMKVVGLPGSMGLVWATALATNLYGGILVFASLAPEEGLTVAQVSVLATMMLVAHGLPLELRIAQKAGPRLRATAVIRFGGALVLGFVLHQLYARGGFLQTPNTALWRPAAPDPSWLAWAIGEARKLVTIFGIILCLLALMKLLRRIGITAVLTRLLKPVLTMLGMSEAAAPVTIIGITMGLTYGGGLIIEEAHSGRLSPRDVFFSLTFMGLCHSLIEDTLLMTVLGAHVSGIFWGRILFASLAIALLVRLIGRLPEASFNRFFFRPAPAKDET